MTRLSALGYELFTPPLSLDFARWSRPEARSYFEWFIDQIPSRLAELARVEAAMSEICPLDLLPESLVCLGKTFGSLVETQPRTQEQLTHARQELPSTLRPVVEVEDWELTEEGLSLCVDVGVYFAEVLRKAHPTLRWEPWVRKTVDLNRPVLVGFRGSVPLDPVRIAINTALSEAAGEHRPNRLSELFDVWSSKVASTE